MAPDGMLTDSGGGLEIEPPRRLVLKWRNEFRPELRAEGYFAPDLPTGTGGEIGQLTVISRNREEGSKFIQAVSNGWAAYSCKSQESFGNRRIVWKKPRMAT